MTIEFKHCFIYGDTKCRHLHVFIVQCKVQGKYIYIYILIETFIVTKCADFSSLN